MIVVTKTLDAIAGSIFIFFNVTGTTIPNNPATTIVKTIEIEIIKEIPEGEVIALYHHQEYIDMCRGPHVPNTKFLKESLQSTPQYRRRHVSYKENALNSICTLSHTFAHIYITKTIKAIVQFHVFQHKHSTTHTHVIYVFQIIATSLNSYPSS